MTVRDLQAKLGVTADGIFGPRSRQALLDHFTNRAAPSVTAADIQAYAMRLGCTEKQIKAVAHVESRRGGFDKQGRPKILFERHWFHRLTNGKWSPSSFSQRVGGGYSESSWGKLLDACALDPASAFSSASWGKFQVMGGHWKVLGYPSAYSMAWTAIQSEADHYEMLVRYIETFGLRGPLRAISTDPEANRAFARGYNGPAFAKLDYHGKLARAMR